jgi:3-methyl-2-oxobutanoate hydroxymethyltransferase
VSSQSREHRVTVPEIVARKGGEPVVVLTAYSAPMARFLDPHVDVLLVGDSLGMVLYGFESTLPVTVDMMIAHGGAVVRGSSHACVVVDMPFGSYQESHAQAYRNCARVIAETGAAAVKLEGGSEMASTIEFVVSRGIPVMGHIGLMPQSVHRYGGFRVQGKKDAVARQIVADGRAVADAGAFSMVVESVVAELAQEVTAAVPVPTIGIGASAVCDGQVLVTEDLTGLFGEFTPRFVKRYADLGKEIGAAAEAYARDVKARRFPGPEQTVSLASPPKRGAKHPQSV